MTDLQKMTFLAATDPEFRKALRDNPKAALVQRGMEVSSEELSALGRVLELIACPPKDLLERLIEGPDQPKPWQLRAPVRQTESG
jgi:hypothetical protein